MLSPKVPGETKDYGLEWEDGLSEGDSIVGSTWAVSPSGSLSVGDSSILGTVTLARLLSGTLGATYTCTNTITTAGGETLIAAFNVEVMSAAAAAGL